MLIQEAIRFCLKRSARRDARAALFGFGLAVTQAAISVTHAADAAETAEPASTLEEVTVSARRVVERLQDVPMSVTSLSGAALEQQSARAVFDVQATVPGLRVRYGSGDQSTLLVSLRGPTHNRQDVTVDPAVGIYVDDVVYAHPVGTNADLLDIQSVEVLQGPQGTLFGRNTIGGALVIRTNDPEFDSSSFVFGAGAGSYGQQRLSGVANLSTGEKFAVRVAAQTAGNDGLQRDLSSRKRALKTEADSGRIKLAYQATDNISLLAGFEYLNIDGVSPVIAVNQITNPTAVFPREVSLQSGGTDTLSEFVNPPSGTTYGNGIGDFTTRAHTEYLRGSWDSSVGLVELITARRTIRHDRFSDIDGTPYVVHHARYNHDLEQYTGELRFSGRSISDRLQWQLGAFYFTEEGDDDTQFTQWPMINGPRTPQNNLAYLETSSTAGYGQATFAFTDRLSITGGVRYTSEDKELVAQNYLGPTDGSGPTICNVPVEVRPATGECIGHLAYDDTQFNYLVSVDYKLTPDVLAYVRHGTGFRAGGLNQRVSSIGTLDPFEGEELVDTEAGLKADWLEGRLRTNLSVFYSEYDNLLLAIQDFLRGSFVTNSGDVEQKGAQLTFDALVARGLRLGGSFGFTDVKYTSVTPLAGPIARDLLPGAPEKTGAINVEYTTDVAIGELTLRADYQWTDEINYVGVRNGFERGYTSEAVGLVNARIGLALRAQPVEIAVWGKNITGEEYLAYGLDQANIGVTIHQWGPPSQFGVDVTYRFGD